MAQEITLRVLKSLRLETGGHGGLEHSEKTVPVRPQAPLLWYEQHCPGCQQLDGDPATFDGFLRPTMVGPQHDSTFPWVRAVSSGSLREIESVKSMVNVVCEMR